jgi:uncharacterized membrane protein SpoIIM required for sporulation/uncharacterized RDD family membrane protein YckC
MSSPARISSRPAPPPSLEPRVDVETPEQVVLSYTVAGVGSRAAAALVDTLICVAALVVIGTLYTATGLRLDARAHLSEEWVVAIVVIAQFLIVWGYYVAFEVLRDGQTPGKRLMRLRVVQESGHGLTLAGAAARNLVRVVDMQPGITYLVGVVAAALSPRGRRVGDVVAGTIVVREEAVAASFDTRGAEAPNADAPNARRPPAPAPLLADAEYALLDRYMARRQAIDPERRATLATQLVTRLRPRVIAAAEVVTGATDYAWLAALHERERGARAGVTVARAPRVGTARASSRAHTVVARGVARWRDFAAMTAGAQKRGGLRSLPEEEVSEFVARYREVATDLARLQTASRDGETDAEFYVARLVAAGHNLLYRRRAAEAGSVARFVLRDVPAEVRRSWRPIALAALLLFGPAAASFTAVVRHPELAPQLVPAGLLERAETGAARGRAGGYLPEDEARLRGPVLASVIMTNNVQVTFLAFALGVTAGVGTALSLVMNGISALGAPLGLYASKGIAAQILGFVLPHGVLELSAICIAGGGGFLLAAAILLPGARTRRDALADEGLRAIRLVTASTLLLIVAGLLEGNVSPRVWPLGLKTAVSLGTVVLMTAWLLPRPRGAAGITAPPAP